MGPVYFMDYKEFAKHLDQILAVSMVKNIFSKSPYNENFEKVKEIIFELNDDESMYIKTA